MRTSSDSGDAAVCFFLVGDESVETVEKAAIHAFSSCVVCDRHSRLHMSPRVPGQVLPERDRSGDDTGGTPLMVKAGRDVEEKGYSYKHVWGVRHSIPPSIWIDSKGASLVIPNPCMLAFSDRTKSRFKACSLLGVTGTSRTRVYLDHQLCDSVMVVQGAVWMITWGMFVPFFTNLRALQLMVTPITIGQLRCPHSSPSASMTANVGADLVLTSFFAPSPRHVCCTCC